MKDATAIVGIGQTEFAKSIDQSELTLAVRAIKAALADAGISPSEVNGLSSFTMEPNMEVEVARNLGMEDVTWFSQVGYGGGAACAVVGQAAMAVATGQCEVAVAWRARKRGARTSRPWAQVAERIEGPAQWSRPFGLLRPVDEIAMLTRRYIHEYGATREHLCNVAMAFRAHANRNPHALMYDKTMTRDDYFASRMISEPLNLFDNCLETDGALAVVVARTDRAKHQPQPSVLVHGYAQGLNAQHQTMTNFHREDPLRGPAWAAADLLWRRADFTPADLDVAQLYDAFSPLIPLSLEGYGIVGRGEGGPFTDDGNLELGGGLPTNTSGGGMSEAYVHGMNLVVEGVRQLRGTSTSQVEGAETCLVSSGEGVPTSALLLRAA